MYGYAYYLRILHHRYLYNDEGMTPSGTPYEIPRVYGFNTDEKENTGPVQDELNGECTESAESGVYMTVM